MIKKLRNFLAFAAILTLLAGLFFLSLPYLTESFILPEITRNLPFSTKKLSITRISPWTIRGMVSLADNNKQCLSIPRFELHYTPQKLIKGQIDTVVLDGGSIHFDMQGNSLSLRGYNPHNSPSTAQEKRPSLILPLAVQTIIIKNSSIIIHRGQDKELVFATNDRFTLNFTNTADNKKKLTAITGKITLQGAFTLKCTLKIETTPQGHEIVLHVNAPDIKPIATLFSQRKNLHMAGQLNATSRISLENMDTVTGYEATLHLSTFTTEYNTIILGSTKGVPIELRLNGDTEKAHFEADNIHISAPQNGDLSLSGEYSLTTGKFKGTSQLQTAISPSAVITTFHGQKKEDRTHLTYSLTGGPFHFAENRFTVNQMTTKGTLNITMPRITGTVQSRISRFIDTKSDITLRNILLNMPFQFPATPLKEKGSFSIDEIRHQNIPCGNFKAKLSSSLRGFTFTSVAVTPFVPSLKLFCNGSKNTNSLLTVQCNIPQTVFNSSLLPSFFKIPEDVSFTSQLQADGTFSLHNSIPTGELHLAVNNGSITFKGDKLSDISFGLNFPRFPSFVSSPSQLCTIGSLAFGKITLSNAKLRFRIENEHTLFLEKSKVSWCDGKVETGSLRISSPFKKLETTLYCDRLSFTKLLSQFGIEDTEGQGSLNGKLPITVTPDEITFDDGFLFSTPGKSGIVRFNNTKQLRQGMPDVAQAAYLDYSLKAMENFSYNWTRLSFNSEKNDLLIAMQLDGKPAKPLPFGYKNGQIVPQKKGPGLQHPIQLDINFRLPLKKLFQYGTTMQSLMEKL